MKKIFAIAFVLLFVLHFAGVYTYFGVRLIAIRKEMKAKLKELPIEKLERIVLSKHEFKKIDIEENELELEGKMYDIAKIERVGNTYEIYALHDEHEDNLLSCLAEIVTRSTTDKKPAPSQLVQFFSLDFITPKIDFECSSSQAQKVLIEYSNLYLSFYPAIGSPPPKS